MGRFYNALNFYRQNETSLTFAFNPKEATGFWMIVKKTLMISFFFAKTIQTYSTSTVKPAHVCGHLH
jgi:hypothetical protein